MATKAKAGKKNGKKELSPVQKLQKEIDDLENQMYDLPDVPDFYPNWDVMEGCKTELKSFQKSLKAAGIQVDASQYLFLCRQLVDAARALEKDMKAEEKRFAQKNKDLQKQINDKNKQIFKIEDQERKNTSARPAPTFTNL